MNWVLMKQSFLLMLVSSVISGFVQKDVRVPLVRVPKTTTIGKQEMNKITMKDGSFI